MTSWNLELPDYSNSTKSEVNLSTLHNYGFLSYPKVEALQGYLLSSHGLCWTLDIPCLWLLTLVGVSK